MKIRIIRIWEELTQSFWFTPTVMAVGGLALAIGLVLIQPWIRPHEIPVLSGLYLADPSGARSVLATIASSAITVAGVVFSITIVVLNMASSQFGPRLLPNFMRHGATQIVLGTYVGTFIYCLTVLSLIRADASGAAVPQLAVGVGLALGVASFGVLIYFIHHVAIFIQAPRIIDDVARQLETALNEAFPPRPEGRPGHVGAPSEEASAVVLIEGRAIRARKAGYVQAMDRSGLLALATEQDIRLRLLVHPGDYVSEGDAVAEVDGEEDHGEDTDPAALACIVLGPQRTQTQDPAFGVYQLVEIGLRALSPGINDPFTAISCIDRLGNAIGVLANREIPSHLVWDDDNQLRLQVKPYTYGSIVGAAFDQIRRTGISHVDVTLRLLQVIANLLQRDLPGPLRDALVEQAQAIRELAGHSELAETDQAALDAAWSDADDEREPPLDQGANETGDQEAAGGGAGGR